VEIGDKQMAKDSKKPFTFPAPDGFSLPDGTEPGEPFQSTVTIQENDDGTLELLELDGLPVEAPEAEPADAGEDDNEDPDGSDDSPSAPMSAGTAPIPPKKRVPMPFSKVAKSKFLKAMAMAKANK